MAHASKKGKKEKKRFLPTEDGAQKATRDVKRPLDKKRRTRREKDWPRPGQMTTETESVETCSATPFEKRPEEPVKGRNDKSVEEAWQRRRPPSNYGKVRCALSRGME